MKITPRNDYVVFKRHQRGTTLKGIHMPDKSLEGIDHVVIAIGPKVEKLAIGDKVLILGKLGEDYGELPNQKGLYLTKCNNVAVIFEYEESDYEKLI